VETAHLCRAEVKACDKKESLTESQKEGSLGTWKNYRLREGKAGQKLLMVEISGLTIKKKGRGLWGRNS